MSLHKRTWGPKEDKIILHHFTSKSEVLPITLSSFGPQCLPIWYIGRCIGFNSIPFILNCYVRGIPGPKTGNYNNVLTTLPSPQSYLIDVVGQLLNVRKYYFNFANSLVLKKLFDLPVWPQPIWNLCSRSNCRHQNKRNSARVQKPIMKPLALSSRSRLCFLSWYLYYKPFGCN